MYSDRYFEGRSSRRSRSDYYDYMGESRRGSYSSHSSINSSRPRWYHEVPVLGSFLRTMKDIFGLHGYSERYQEIETGRRRRSRQSSRPSNTHTRTNLEDEYYFRRPSAKLQKHHSKRRTQECRSPRYSSRSNNPVRCSNAYRNNDPLVYQYQYQNPHQYQTEHPSRSSSTSSYTRSRPQIIDRSPETQPRKRKVSFTDPLETLIPPTNEYKPTRPQKRPSIDDHQTGSRKRVPLEIHTRSPRPRSPVIERIPPRRGKRIPPIHVHELEAESPDIQYIPARENRHSTSYTENIEIIDRGPGLGPSTHSTHVNFSRGYRRTPSIVDTGRYDLDKRSWRVLNESSYRRPSHHREFEVRRD